MSTGASSMRAYRWSLSILLAGLAALSSAEARAEVTYDDGLRVTGSRGGMGLNVFVRPRYEYESDDGTGESRSTFSLDLFGARLRAWDQRRQLLAQVMGGMAVDEPVLLDTYMEVRPAETVGIRFGYFRLAYDEQTTHGPFWLRMTERSIDVAALSHEYDLGIALVGTAFGDSLAFSLSVTNGEEPSLENLNVDFLYAARLALRLGPLFNWRNADVVVGFGASWTLEPWEPEPDLEVNRSIFRSTFDLSGRIRGFTLTAAALYEWSEPGAYGAPVHGLGWHVEAGLFAGEYFELAVRTAGLVPDLAGDAQQLEVAAALNGFPDRGRLRVQLQYSYIVDYVGDEVDRDSHRVVLQWQALY